nr:hypothetical protein Itr_chr09CG09770 [Ipomoea trifida]
MDGSASAPHFLAMPRALSCVIFTDFKSSAFLNKVHRHTFSFVTTSFIGVQHSGDGSDDGSDKNFSHGPSFPMHAIGPPMIRVVNTVDNMGLELANSACQLRIAQARQSYSSEDIGCQNHDQQDNLATEASYQDTGKLSIALRNNSRNSILHDQG